MHDLRSDPNSTRIIGVHEAFLTVAMAACPVYPPELHAKEGRSHGEVGSLAVLKSVSIPSCDELKAPFSEGLKTEKPITR
jgi:hypothetical protein